MDVNRPYENNHTFTAKELVLPPAETQHVEEFKPVCRKKLINILNKINFQDNFITVNFKHPKYQSVLSFRAKPQTCIDENLYCLWDELDVVDDRISSYEFLNFQVSNGLNQLLVDAEPLYIGRDKFQCRLPEKCLEVSGRKVKRHQCNDVYVQICQNSVVFYGLLTGFSCISQTIDISMVPSALLRRINVHSSIDIILKNDQHVIYSGSCTIIRLSNDHRVKTMVVKPVVDRIQRFRPKEYRSERQQLLPSPDIIFTHPLTGRMVNLKIVDISGSGFSVMEKYDSSVFVPGMIIYDARIEYANSLLMKCDLQVLYCHREKDTAKSGLVILDMDAQEHVRLMGLLLQAENQHSYISTNNIDLDDLWNFFFETGFVYPEKYAFIEPQKEKFKQVYRKLYTEPSEISRHIIYQDKGKIYGHVAMLRFYDKTWLIQHHAALVSGHNKAGLIVAEQLGRYINEFHHLASANMNYLACYYRRENRFPDRIFGGIARALNNPQASSIDLFGYLHFRRDSVSHETLESLELVPSQPDDLDELNTFYQHFAGGLMLHALDLTPDIPDYADLNAKFYQQGFRRQRNLFSLKEGGTLKAIFMVNISDVGLNMSDLTNCVQIFFLDAANIRRAVLDEVLVRLCQHYDDDEIPVLVYPQSYAEANGLICDKTYNLLVLSVEYFDHYIKHLGSLLHLQKKAE
jgi:hypothetical protein